MHINIDRTFACAGTFACGTLTTRCVDPDTNATCGYCGVGSSCVTVQECDSSGYSDRACGAAGAACLWMRSNDCILADNCYQNTFSPKSM